MGRDAIIRKLQTFKERMSKQHKIDALLFFGSRANGRPDRWSDIDLVVVSQWFEGKRRLVRARWLRKAWDLGYPVDFLCYTPEEFRERAAEPTIVKEALKKGILI